MVSAKTREAEIVELLHEVKDPEVPVLDIVELGIVRGIELAGSEVIVRLTPTYSGCPAMRVIEEQVVTTLERHGFGRVTVKLVFNPAWTTDWIEEPAKEKLRAYGIAPPGRTAELELVTLGRPTRSIPCPFCGSSNTTLESQFGSTACKALHVCRSCHQPFEHFKPI